LRQIVSSGEAKDDIRAVPQHIAMNILKAIHRLVEDDLACVKMLKDQGGEKPLRVGDFRVRFSELGGKIRIHGQDRMPFC
jgi:hypothetical protein